MILRVLKEKSNQKYISDCIENRIPTVNSKKINTILIIHTLEEYVNHNHFYNLTRDLNVSDSNVKILSFTQNKKIEKTVQPNTFYLKAFGCKGHIKDVDLNAIINLPFDLLLNLSKENHVLLNLITTKSIANFKVGISKKNKQLFDLVIDSKPSEYKAITLELIKYLKILNKL